MLPILQTPRSDTTNPDIAPVLPSCRLVDYQRLPSGVSSNGRNFAAMASVPAATVVPVAQDANIIRDASLDQYLEAHQQFAQQPVMPGSMPLIRAAAVSTQGQ